MWRRRAKSRQGDSMACGASIAREIASSARGLDNWAEKHAKLGLTCGEAWRHAAVGERGVCRGQGMWQSKEPLGPSGGHGPIGTHGLHEVLFTHALLFMHGLHVEPRSQGWCKEQ